MSQSDGDVRAMPGRLGLRPAVLTRLAAMTGAGLFVVFAPAAASAGSRLAIAVLIAAGVAMASAHSVIRLAAATPRAKGGNDTGTKRLGLPWANLSGWALLVAAAAGVAAMAMTIGVHLWPDNSKIVAILAVLGALALHLQDIRRSSFVPQVIVAGTVVVVLVFAAVLLIAPPVTVEAPPAAAPGAGGPAGLIQGAGFVFFVFVGFGRISHGGASVADARRTSIRATALALGITAALHLLVAMALTHTLGSGWVAARQAPLAEAAEISAWPWLGAVLRIVAVLAAGGVLLSLVVAASDTTISMARERHLPEALAALDGQGRSPRRVAAIVAGIAVIIIVLADLPEAIGLSSFLFLGYYALASASAWTLDSRLVARLVPTLGVLGCLLLAALLPWPSVVAGILALMIGAVIGWVRHTTSEGRPA